MDQRAALVQDQQDHLVEGEAGGLLDQLVEQRVALGLGLGQRHRVGAGQVGPGAHGQRARQAVVVGPVTAGLVGEQHEPADRVNDPDRRHQRALQGEVVGHIAEKRAQLLGVAGGEVLVLLDRVEQGVAGAPPPVDGLRPHAFQADALLGHEGGPVRSGQVVAADR